MIKKILFIPVLAALCGWSGLLHAADAPAKGSISVKAEVDKAFITIGDPILYTVTIRRDPSVQILSTIPNPAADLFKIKKIDEFKREEKGGVIIEGRKMQLTTYRLGEFIIDPIKIDYKIGNGATQSIETDRLFISVKSVAAGENKTDIRGVKSVLQIPKQVLAFLIPLVVILFLLLGYMIWKGRKKLGPALVPKTPLTIEEEALLELDKLFESDLLRKDKIKEYYLKLSEILRIYVEKRFQVLATESTTYELMRLLKQKSLDRQLYEKIDEVLNAADLAKFAKWKPEPAQVIQINQKSKQIVEESKPKETSQSGV